jgi:PucR family transcriptional regulator, purine catabolism regulatory protein
MMIKPFTIEELVKKIGPDGVVLKAGQKGKTNQITNVNIIDNPDSMAWLISGDFIMTTGYVFLDNNALQKQLIRDLSEQNCAGLGIKIKRYWDEIPESILLEANRLNFPIIEIPYKYSLSQIANIVNQEVFGRSTSLLNKYRDIHHLFSQCSINGGDLYEIATLTTKLIMNPVIILDSQFNLLAFADHEDSPYPLNTHLKLIEQSKVFPKAFNDTIPTNVELFSLSIKQKIMIDNNEITCRVIPIAYSQTIYGYIIVWEVLRKLEKIDYIALESAAQTSAIERVKRRQFIESQLKVKKDFFDDLLEGRIFSINALKSTAPTHGLDPNKNYVICVIELHNVTKDRSIECLLIADDKAMVFNRTVRSVLKELDLILFIELLVTDDIYELNLSIKEFINNLSFSLQDQNTNEPFHIGVSNICIDFLKIGKAYYLAKDILRISKKLDKKQSIIYFDDLASYHLLDAFQNQQQLQTFYNTFLGVLDAYDVVNGTELVKTLELYFLDNMNVSQAAKKMFIHRNTLIYRIEKITQILKCDFKDSEYIFNIQLAIKIRKML